MKKIKKLISLLLVLACIASCGIAGSITSHAAGTGVGLAEHALNAYYSKWAYVYGGASKGAVDCSGLIYMYAGGARMNMVGVSPQSGYVSNGIPNIHGLGLWQPGHVGVYVGAGMGVDARGTQWGVCYQSVYTKTWTKWFKVKGVSYPTNGWELFNGQYYYYQNGQYLTNTTVTVDGVTYTLGKTGACTTTPANVNAVASNTGSANTSKPKDNSLKVGSSGSSVTKLQKRLTALGFYSGDITGYFGEQTKAALIKFQKAAGVTANGVATTATTKVLYSNNAPKIEAPVTNTTTTTTTTTTPVTEPTTTPSATTNNNQTENDTPEVTVPEEEVITTYGNGSFHDNVYKIQTELATLGYFDDEATGYFGDVTESAVVMFQFENGLDTTGEVDEETFEVIFSEKALENPYVEDQKIELVAPEADSTETTETTTSAETVNNAVTPVSSTEADEIVLKSAELAAKGLEGMELELDDVKSSTGNGSFMAWMIVMVIFMGTAFWFVFSSEKKKKRARAERIKARANRKW